MNTYVFVILQPLAAVSKIKNILYDIQNEFSVPGPGPSVWKNRIRYIHFFFHECKNAIFKMLKNILIIRFSYEPF